jgi:hypothetical protein
MSTHAARSAVRGHDVLTWAVAEAPFPNELESGDQYVVETSDEGILIAAIDGAGHGAEAAAAARIATATVRAHPHESPIALLLRCHEELRGTRGVVMTIAFIDTRDRTITWSGVGNVEALLFHGAGGSQPSPARAMLRSGVLGFRLPAMRAEVLPLAALDTLVIVTDGIRPDFDDGLVLADDPQVIANGILARHFNRADDALVLVARYLGGPR